ncbi:type I iterative polyketide synthase [Apiospora phragmitis]|uniref:Type I iterative polyketide synthase n=1 Tax=Apiospora phragmitis TaxID=2905665 RepID=A0ABR1SWL8_9PEZI
MHIRYIDQVRRITYRIVKMPFMRATSSPGESSTESGYGVYSAQAIVNDETYAAKLLSTSAEKPLSEQLEPIAVVGMVVYEAFESAGVTLVEVAGSKTAVFAASFTSDFQQMCFKEPSFRHSFAATGVDPGILSNRISHVFNLRGPSIVVNTACSSSIYAVHNACNALRNKECAAAVVGGVNLVLTVGQHINTAKLGMLSPNSACSTFDAAADGYGRAEGVGAVYLKRLSDAIRDGDPIRAVIRSSATNNNGRVPAVGITHPNRDGQVEVITHAYQRGGNLDPLLTGYLECHGTGITVGDPLEVHAVSLAMNQSRRPGEDPPLMVGAVKTNIGHSEAASGLSALIKAVLSVERGVVIPTRLKNPSPSIKWDQWAVTVPTEPTAFRHSQIKRVSVNSFGYGGTNAHIIVEGADSLLTQMQSYRYHSAENKRSMKIPRGAFHRNRPFLLTFSAHDKATLQRNLDVLGPVSGNYNMLDLAYTLGNRRTAFSSRGFKVLSRPELEKGKFEGLTFAENRSAPTVVFVFTGHGAQWAPVEPYLAPYHGQIAVACHNSPAGVTLSGDASAIEKLGGELNSQNIFARAVKTSGKAYHSAHMAPAAERYELLFRRAKEQMLPFDLPIITDAKMVSSVTNYVLQPDQAVDDVYFSQNLRNPVLFNQAVQTIMTNSEFAKVDMLIEVGPHSAMGGPIRQIKSALGHAKMEYLPTLVRGEDSAARMLMLAGELFLRNYALDIDRVTSVEETIDSGKVVYKRGNLIVDLPPYQWSRKCYWAENRQSVEHRAPRYARHDLLGALVPGASPVEPTWRNFLRIRDVPGLKDHSLGGEAVFPAAGYFSKQCSQLPEVAMEAITQLKETVEKDCEITNYVLRDISIHKALVTPDDDIGIEIDQDGALRNHMAGSLSVKVATQRPDPKASGSLKQRASGKEWNQALRAVDFDYGPTFADMTNINFNGVDYICTCETKLKTAAGNVEGESRHVLHPSTVDRCLQLMIASIYAGRSSAMSAGIIPIQVDEVAIWKPRSTQLISGDASATAWTDERGTRSFVCGNQLVAEDGQVLMQMRNMRGTLYDAAVTDIITRSWFESLQQFMDLAVFKDPSYKVLDIGGLHALTLLSVFPELHYTAVTADADTERVDAEITPFKNAKREKCALDNAIISETVKRASIDAILADADDEVDELLELLVENGRILRINDNRLTGVRAVNHVPREMSASDDEVQILYRTATSFIINEVLRACSNVGLKGQTLQLSQAKTIQPHVIVLDLEQSLLSDITKEEFEVVQSVASHAKTLLWATAGGLLRGQKPEAAMVAGLMRSVRSENAAINIVTVDFDLESTSTEQVAVNVASTTANQLKGGGRLENDRLLPNERINKTYGTDERELEEISFDFDPMTPLRDVEARVSLAGLNRESIQVIAGTDISTKFSHEVGGVVSRVGSAVQGNSRVAAPESSPEESMTDFAGLPMAYSSALYALQHLAKIQPAEAILILPGTGLIGAAAIQVARVSGATPYVFVTNETEASSLQECYGLDSPQMLSSEEELLAFLRSPRGCVDIVLGCASTPASMSREAWRHIAGFGRKKVLKRNTLDPVPLQRGANYFSFDILELCADAKNAAVLVEELKIAGANFQVTRGDVSVLQDVKRADSLFYKMSYQDWIVSTRPKVQGAANLQVVLSGMELDFFLVTSSVSGILGTPGQPSYAAANAYLDALAHHRRVKGERGCSAILPMILGVGVVSENTELEESLKRKGMYGIDEEFLLRSVELAVHEQQTNATCGSQVVIGLNPSLLFSCCTGSGRRRTFLDGRQAI